MIVSTSHDPYEPGFRLQSHGTTISCKRKAGAQAVQASGLGFGWGFADDDYFRVGKAHRSNGCGAELALFACNDFGDHFPLCHRPVREHRFAGQIANRPDIAHAGLAAVINGNCRPVHGQRQGFKVEALGAWFTADSHQHLIGFKGLALAHAVAHRQGFGTGLKALDAVLQVQSNAQCFE